MQKTVRGEIIYYFAVFVIPTNMIINSVQSEERTIQSCSDHLHVTLKPRDIERGHSLSHYANGRCCPLIVKLSFSKTKEASLSKSRKLKGTAFSICEDFSHPV